MRQIRLLPLGLWHRPINGHTACDIEIVGPVAARDGYGSGLDLCPICFTPKERDNAEMKRIALDALLRAQADAFNDDDEDKTNPEITVIPNDHERKGTA